MAELMITEQQNLFKLVGDVTFNNAMNTEKQGTTLLLKCFTNKILEIDIELSEIKAVDSSLMTVLLSWIKLAKVHNAKLNFTGITKTIESLVKLNDLNFMFEV